MAAPLSGCVVVFHGRACTAQLNDPAAGARRVTSPGAVIGVPACTAPGHPTLSSLGVKYPGGLGAAAARVWCASAWSLARQHFLCFLPLPQGQRSFRPILAIAQLRHEERLALYRPLLADARFHRLLLAMDDNIAADYRAAGCGPCGGVLHAAWYRRKPRGRPAEPGWHLRPEGFRFLLCRSGSVANARRRLRWGFSAARFITPRW